MSYAQIDNDHAILDLLEAVEDPNDAQKTELCCIFSRYHDHEIGLRASDLAYAWGYSPRTLQDECRDLWVSGFRPTKTTTEGGSSYDATT